MKSPQAIRKDDAHYNFAEFKRYVLRADVQRTIRRHGIWPGDVAPDFTLPLASGEFLTLHQMLGRPVLLHFGSYT
jgi:hypothetical protein